jgi:hypothetical protein
MLCATAGASEDYCKEAGDVLAGCNVNLIARAMVALASRNFYHKALWDAGADGIIRGLKKEKKPSRLVVCKIVQAHQTMQKKRPDLLQQIGDVYAEQVLQPPGAGPGGGAPLDEFVPVLDLFGLSDFRHESFFRAVLSRFAKADDERVAPKHVAEICRVALQSRIFHKEAFLVAARSLEREPKKYSFDDAMQVVHALAACWIRDESALNAAGDVFVASMRVATPHQITVAFNSFAGLRFNHSAFIRASSDRIIAEVQSFSDEDLGLIVLACDRLRIKPAQMLQKIAKSVEPRFGYLRGKTLSNLLQGLSRLGFLEKGARKPMQDFIETPNVQTELRDTERSVIAYAIRPDVSNNLAMRPNTAPAATGKGEAAHDLADLPRIKALTPATPWGRGCMPSRRARRLRPVTAPN